MKGYKKLVRYSNLGFLWDGADGGAFEAWGDFAQLPWSVEDLCEDGGAGQHRISGRLVSHRLGLVLSFF